MPGSSSTNAPKSAIRVTLPSTRAPVLVCSAKSSHGLRIIAFKLKLILRVSVSMRLIFTSTESPILKSELGSSTRCHEISETGSRPSAPPRSTKTPNGFTERTMPVFTCPSAAVFQNSSALIARSRSITARRLTIKFFSSGFTSATITLIFWFTNCSMFSTR